MNRSIFTLLVAMLVTTPFAHATIIQYAANLSGPSQAPPNASPATGSAVVTVDDILNTLRVEVSFSGLLAVTTAAHIHCCTATPLTGTVGVATTTPSFAGFPLGVTAGSYDNTLDMTLAASYNPSFLAAQGGTTAAAEAFLFNGLSLDQAYFNLHTAQFPAGEIRGFLTRVSQPVSEPATLALFGLGLVGLGWRYRKQACLSVPA